MKQFNVIIWNPNAKRFETYDIIPRLVDEYKALKKSKTMQKIKPLPETFEEFRKFVKDEIMYQWWGRTEYEIILVDFINLRDAERRNDLMEYMKECLADDPLRCEAVDITKLGIMEIVRKRGQKTLAASLLI